MTADGLWRAVLPSLSVQATPFNITFADASIGTLLATISDVLVGDVVFASGQSNQQLSLSMALNATAEIAALDAFGPMVRVLYVAGDGQAEPQTDLPAAPSIPWSRAAAATMGGQSWGGFSATAWFTARDLFLSLGGTVPVGVVEAAVGGTAIRCWSSVGALAACPTPYNSPVPYGTGPYAHSVLYNGLVAPFTTGPTPIKLVVWDQAESDSFPQTPVGYYDCATVAQISSWRAAFKQPLLPWLFIHLQPYTGSGPCCLENLRASQLTAMLLPAVGVASAIDLGDPGSPYGNVHFRDKQTISSRLVAAAQVVAYGGGPAASAYPPPSFLTQTSYLTGATSSVVVTFSLGGGSSTVSLLPASAVSCPAGLGLNASNCTDFLLLGSDGASYPVNASALLPPSSSSPGQPQQLILNGTLPEGVYAVGSSYAFCEWPLARLFGDGNLPMLPWRQALTMAGAPGPLPTG